MDTTKTADETMINVREAARRAGVHRRTIERLIGRGEIPTFRASDRGHYRMFWSDVVHAMANHKGRQQAV